MSAHHHDARARCKGVATCDDAIFEENDGCARAPGQAMRGCSPSAHDTGLLT